MGFNISQKAYAPSVGTTSVGGVWLDTRDPTSQDINFIEGQLWLNQTTEFLWMLNSFSSSTGVVTANWINLNSGSTAIDSVEVDAFTAPGTNPVLADANGLITVTGAQVAAGTVGTNVIRTDSLAANTYTIEIQRSTSAGVSTLADNGVCHFNSGQFTVDGNGFVSLSGGGLAIDSIQVDTFTAPGTNPVAPNGAGLITVTGGQVAAGTTANVIQTDSLAANTYTIQVQRSQAVASSTVGDNGVCHFNSAHFTVDSNGFVSANNSGTGWVVVTTNQTLADSTGYFANGVGRLTFTLPATTAVGDTYEIQAMAATGWTVAQGAGQSIVLEGLSSTVGAGGSITSTALGDWIRIVCNVANTGFVATMENGVATVV